MGNLFTDAELLRMSEKRYRALKKQFDEVNESLIKKQLDNINLRIRVKELEIKLCSIQRKED